MGMGWLLILLILAAIVIAGGARLLQWASGESVCSDQERKRIVTMVEEGKISTEEGAELLDALGKSTALRGQDKLSRLDILVMVGAVIVFLGFLLPWITVRDPQYPHNHTRYMYLAGYDYGAIGWAVVAIAVLGTILVFVTPKEMLYKISMLQMFFLLLGCVTVVVLLFQSFNKSNSFCPGLFVCIGGYALMFAASVVKYKKLAA